MASSSLHIEYYDLVLDEKDEKKKFKDLEI